MNANQFGFGRRQVSKAAARASRAIFERLEDRRLFAIAYMGDETAYAANDQPVTIAAADVNHDGHADAIVSSVSDGSIAVLLGNGAGALTNTSSIALGNLALDMEVVDVNGDTHPDIVTTAHNENGVFVIPGNGDGTFGAPVNIDFDTYGSWNEIGVGDLNGDGKPDLAVAAAHAQGVVVRLNTGPGITYGDETLIESVEYLQDVGLADVNNDGKLDILTTGYSSMPIGVMINNGSGFDPQVAYARSYDSVTEEINAVDVNKDGWRDIVMMYQSGSFDILLNQGNGTFGAPTAFTTLGGSGYGVVDMNNDGNVDFISANDLYGNISISEGNGDGTFNSKQNKYFFGSNTKHAAFADFNGDGKTDAVLADQKNAQVLVSLNESAGAPPVEDPGDDDPIPPVETADLVMSVQTLPTNVIWGDKGTIKVVVTNSGQTKFKDRATVKLFVSTDGVLDDSDTLITEVSKKLSLKQGKEKKLSLNVEYPAIGEGAYQILAKVEGPGESNTNNNVGISIAPVQFAAPFIDLSPAITKHGQSVKLGKSLKGKLSIQNLGNVTAKGKVQMSYYASSNGSLDGATLLGQASKKLTLKAGKALSVSLSKKVPQTLAAGSYQLIAVIEGLAATNPTAVSAGQFVVV